MSEEFRDLMTKLNDFKRLVELRIETTSKIESESIEIKEFLQLLLNECEKLSLEVKQAIESTSGLKGIFGARKKKAKIVSEKVDKLKTSILEGDSKIYGFYLNYLTDLEDSVAKVIKDYNLVREEMDRRKITWKKLVDVKSLIYAVKDALPPLKERILNTKGIKNIDSIDFIGITGAILAIRNDLNSLQIDSETLQKKMAFRNIVLAKINSMLNELEGLPVELLDKLDVKPKLFLEKLVEKAASEDTPDSYLEEALNLMDSVNLSYKNTLEIVTLFQNAGIPLEVIVEQPDIKNALTLLRIILGQFKINFKDYIDQETQFTNKLKEISAELSPILSNLMEYLNRLGNAYSGFTKFIQRIVESWFLNCRQRGGWSELKRSYLVVESFLLNHYPSINECLKLRIKGVNPQSIKGVSLFQSCVPNEYQNEKLIYETILPGILQVEGIDVLRNAINSYGERGWIKRSEVKNISDEYIENYVQVDGDIKKINVEALEFLVAPKTIMKKVPDLSNESLYNYFNKYISDRELSKKITDALKTIL